MLDYRHGSLNYNAIFELKNPLNILIYHFACDIMINMLNIS